MHDWIVIDSKIYNLRPNGFRAEYGIHNKIKTYTVKDMFKIMSHSEYKAFIEKYKKED